MNYLLLETTVTSTNLLVNCSLKILKHELEMRRWAPLATDTSAAALDEDAVRTASSRGTLRRDTLAAPQRLASQPHSTRSAARRGLPQAGVLTAPTPRRSHHRGGARCLAWTVRRALLAVSSRRPPLLPVAASPRSPVSLSPPPPPHPH